MKPRILVYPDDIMSPCSFYRSFTPLAELQRQGLIDIEEGDYFNDHVYRFRAFDIALFQRPMSHRCLQTIMEAKDSGLKIWVDLDDYNFIPPHHSAYKLYCKEYKENEFSKIMMLADVVTVSTEPLKKHYLTYNNNVKVVQNAFNDHWLDLKTKSDEKLIVIRGGETHTVDMWRYRDEIIEVMRNHLDWKLITLGGREEFFIDKKFMYDWVDNTNIHNYFGWLFNNTPSIVIVPLEDNDLNRCKSNISWIESTMCGAVTLTPDYWHMNGAGETYSSKEEFKDKFESLIVDSDKREVLFDNSKEELNKRYLLSKVNKLRMNLINKLS